MGTKVSKIIGFFLIILLLLAGALVFFSIFYARLNLEKDSLLEPIKPSISVEPGVVVVPDNPVEEKKEEKAVVLENNNMNLLLLGSDARSVSEAGRSDTIILVGLNLTEKKITLMSFPRDLRVMVPGHANYGYVKLNSTFNSAYFSDGGPELVIKTIETLVQGLTVEGYIKTNFEGFVKFVDALGGIDYDVEERMEGGLGSKHLVLEPGPQHLNGEEALVYMRFRYDGIGDYGFITTTETITKADGTREIITVEHEVGRAARQKKLLTAVINQTKNIRDLRKLPAMMKAIKQSYVSSLSDLALSSLVLKFKDIGEEDIKTIPFPASRVGSLWEGGRSISYVFPPETQQEYQDKILKYFPN